MLDKRIKFLQEFVDKEIDYELTFHRASLSKSKADHCGKYSEQNPANPGPLCFLIDKREAWKCNVCKTGHPNPRTDKPRPRYFHGLASPSKDGISLQRKPSFTRRRGADYAVTANQIKNTRMDKNAPLLIDLHAEHV